MADKAELALQSARVAMAMNSAIIGHLRRKGLLSDEEWIQLSQSVSALAKCADTLDELLTEAVEGGASS